MSVVGAGIQIKTRVIDRIPDLLGKKAALELKQDEGEKSQTYLQAATVGTDLSDN
jgi:hypothetical protein